MRVRRDVGATEPMSAAKEVGRASRDLARNRIGVAPVRERLNSKMIGIPASTNRRIGGRKWLALGGLLVIAVVAAASVAFADYPQNSVAVYTGCLTTGGTASGQLSSLAASATTPLKACSSNQRLVHLSGGTITNVIAGSGLTGGGSNGYVTLGLSGGYALPQSCANGQIATWNTTTSAWQCADDQTYSNGTGLDLNGSEFSVTSSYRLPQSCTSGDVPHWNGSAWQCGGAASRSHAYVATNTLSTTAGSDKEIVGLSDLPTGSYVVMATVRNKGGDDIQCVIGAPGTGSTITASNSLGTIADGTVGSLTGVISVTGGGDVADVQCQSGSVVGVEALIIATPVDGVN